ncbi:hypothetical protein HDU96_003748, partial [Phlyctochytrium bullatum]
MTSAVVSSGPPTAGAKKDASTKTPSLPGDSGKPLAKSSTGSKAASTASLRKENVASSTGKLPQTGSKIGSKASLADRPAADVDAKKQTTKESGKSLAKSSTGSKAASTTSLRKANVTSSTGKLPQRGSKTGSKASLADRAEAKKQPGKVAAAHASTTASHSSPASAKKAYGTGPWPAAGSGSRHSSTTRLASKSTAASKTSLKAGGHGTGSKAGSRTELGKQQASVAPAPAEPLPKWAERAQQKLSTLGPFIFKDGCPHAKTPSQLLRFVSWTSKHILTVCRFGCPEGLTAESGTRRRVVAVSHVWGIEPCCIAVPGIPWGVPIGHAKDLAEAFAGCHDDDLHWLDILCIDQTSTEELMVATRHMSEVFGAADLVNVWLPTVEEPWPVLGIVPAASLKTHLNATGALLPEVAAKALQEAKFATARVTKFLDDYSYNFKGAKTVEDEMKAQNSALAKLIEEAASSPWFQRVWTTQELVLAPRLAFYHAPLDSDVLLYWVHDFAGTVDHMKDFTWHEVANSQLRARIVDSLRLKQQLLQHHQSTSPTAFPLQALYDAIAYRECSYQRDKIITMAPLLRQQLDLPAYDPADASEDLAERLWHHLVRKWVQAGDISVLSVVAPN